MQPLPVQFYVSLELDVPDQVFPNEKDLDPYSITSGFDADLHIVEHLSGEEAVESSVRIERAL